MRLINQYCYKQYLKKNWGEIVRLCKAGKFQKATIIAYLLTEDDYTSQDSRFKEITALSLAVPTYKDFLKNSLCETFIEKFPFSVNPTKYKNYVSYYINEKYILVNLPKFQYFMLLETCKCFNLSFKRILLRSVVFNKHNNLLLHDYLFVEQDPLFNSTISKEVKLTLKKYFDEIS